MNIVFIGGGNAAKELLEIFIDDNSVNILSVVDLNYEATGMLYARNMGISTSTDMDEVIKRMDVNVILEVTGNAKVRKRIIELMREDQDIITADAARMMYGLMCKQAIERNSNIADEIIKLSSHLVNVIKSIDKTSHEIKKILNISQIITLNTQIEAAHIGEEGRTFRVIGERLQDMFEDIKKALDTINQSSQDGHSSLKLLEETEKNLRTMDKKKNGQNFDNSSHASQIKKVEVNSFN